MKFSIALASIISLCSPVSAQTSETVFVGVPTLKAEEMVVERAAAPLDREAGLNYRSVITKIGENYYWASRDNALMVRRHSGAFVEFIAVDKMGYVRVIDPELKDLAKILGPAEELYDYVEHVVVGLRSVNYWGQMESPPEALSR